MRGADTPTAEGCRFGWPAIGAALDVSPATAQRLAAEGQIPIIHLGRRVATTDLAIRLTLTSRALGVEPAELVGMVRALYRRTVNGADE
jgi:hypothetical protein